MFELYFRTGTNVILKLGFLQTQHLNHHHLQSWIDHIDNDGAEEICEEMPKKMKCCCTKSLNSFLGLCAPETGFNIDSLKLCYLDFLNHDNIIRFPRASVYTTYVEGQRHRRFMTLALSDLLSVTAMSEDS